MQTTFVPIQVDLDLPDFSLSQYLEEKMQIEQTQKEVDQELTDSIMMQMELSTNSK